MKRFLPAVLAVLTLSIALAPAATAGLPPLLDRELFFGDPEITGGQLSPDGKFVSFIKPYKGVRNVWVKGIDESFDAARAVTADKRPVPGYFWSHDGRFILYVQDKGGNENYHVYAVDPAGKPAADGVPAARDLTPIEGIRAVIYAVPRRHSDVIVVGLNDRDQAYHDLYRVKIATGERELLLENKLEVAAFTLDLDGQVRVAMRQTPDGGTEFFRVEGGKLSEPFFTCNYQEECSPYQFHKDGKRLYFVENRGEGVDLTRLTLLDVATGKSEVVESDPEKQVDFGGAVFSDVTEELIATFYVGDRLRIYPHDKAVARDLELLRKQLPDGELGFQSATADMSKMLVSVSSDVDPGSVYLYDRASGKAQQIYRSRPDLPSESLAPMQALRYRSRDGLEIPAYLTLPKGVPPKNLPVVIHPHGGPWSRDTWGYDGYAQFLANRGYAVLQMNFSGSEGYGKAFLNAGNRQWGTGAMQHDITDGVKYLVERGIADPKRVCIFGGSYGGYATLAGVTFTPELYACGIPYVAPSSILTLIESFPAYWRPFLQGTWFKRVGDPEVEADRRDMEARSPIHFVDRIRVPLLVVHGANDPRVKQAESDRIVASLRDKKQAVEYIVAPDEGHGFSSPENRMALAVAMERFLGQHLGGRVQSEVPATIAQRLTTITVDPTTVAVGTAPATGAPSASSAAPGAN